MDFNYSPEQEAYRQEVRTWLEANQPPPLTPEEKERIDEDLLWERNKRWHKKLYEHGWVGLNWPKEYGGRGATFIEQVIFQQGAFLGGGIGGACADMIGMHSVERTSIGRSGSPPSSGSAY